MQWSYGKYVEGLDKERMLLMMENEVKGRIPPEPLPVQDPGIITRFCLKYNYLQFFYCKLFLQMLHLMKATTLHLMMKHLQPLLLRILGKERRRKRRKMKK